MFCFGSSPKFSWCRCAFFCCSLLSQSQDVMTWKANTTSEKHNPCKEVTATKRSMRPLPHSQQQKRSAVVVDFIATNTSCRCCFKTFPTRQSAKSVERCHLPTEFSSSETSSSRTLCVSCTSERTKMCSYLELTRVFFVSLIHTHYNR